VISQGHNWLIYIKIGKYNKKIRENSGKISTKSAKTGTFDIHCTLKEDFEDFRSISKKMGVQCYDFILSVFTFAQDFAVVHLVFVVFPGRKQYDSEQV